MWSLFTWRLIRLFLVNFLVTLFFLFSCTKGIWSSIFKKDLCHLYKNHLIGIIYNSVQKYCIYNFKPGSFVTWSTCLESMRIVSVGVLQFYDLWSYLTRLINNFYSKNHLIFNQSLKEKDYQVLKRNGFTILIVLVKRTSRWHPIFKIPIPEPLWCVLLQNIVEKQQLNE